VVPAGRTGASSGHMLTAVRRCGVYWTLIEAASQYTDDVVGDADIVAVTGSPPKPRQWSEQARDAAESAVPGLLTRWDIEPPANRLALAALAAIFPAHGQVLAARIAALAAEQEGTQAGSCAQIASQLIAGDFRDAASNAAMTSLWGETHTEYDIGNELLQPADLATAILSNQVLKLLTYIPPGAAR
jgi:hypothetical protein